MAFIALLAAIALGILGWSGWWSVPLGFLMFIGSLRALPDKAHRVNAVGIPLYTLAMFLIMKAAGWIGSLF